MSQYALSFRNWSIRHPLMLGFGFFAFYMTWFSLLEKYRTPVIWIHTGLDRLMPFCEYFIVPYLLWFVYVGGTFVYFYLKNKKDYFNQCRYLFTGLIICLIIYTLVPTGIHLRHAVVGDNIFCDLVRYIYSVDTSTNVCPSIHVYASIVTHRVISESRCFSNNLWIKAGSLILCILICMSTVLLDQHSVVDVFWGSMLAYALHPLAYRSFFDSMFTGSRRVHTH